MGISLLKDNLTFYILANGKSSFGVRKRRRCSDFMDVPLGEDKVTEIWTIGREQGYEDLDKW